MQRQQTQAQGKGELQWLHPQTTSPGNKVIAWGSILHKYSQSCTGRLQRLLRMTWPQRIFLESLGSQTPTFPEAGWPKQPAPQKLQAGCLQIPGQVPASSLKATLSSSLPPPPQSAAASSKQQSPCLSRQVPAGPAGCRSCPAIPSWPCPAPLPQKVNTFHNPTLKLSVPTLESSKHPARPQADKALTGGEGGGDWDACERTLIKPRRTTWEVLHQLFCPRKDRACPCYAMGSGNPQEPH